MLKIQFLLQFFRFLEYFYQLPDEDQVVDKMTVLIEKILLGPMIQMGFLRNKRPACLSNMGVFLQDMDYVLLLEAQRELLNRLVNLPEQR